MKKLIYFTLVICSSFALIATEPDLSSKIILQDVFNELESSPVTHLDLRLATANLLLYSGRLHHEFKGLEYVQSGKYKLSSDYSKIICNIYLKTLQNDCEVVVIGDDIFYLTSSSTHHYLANNLTERLINAKTVYENIRDLAKQQINHLINDEDIIVILHGVFEEDKDNKKERVQERIAKWENGEAIFYEAFFDNL